MSNTNTKEYIKWAIILLIPICIALMPTTEVFTHQIKMYLAITIWAILMFIFELIPNGVTALLLMLLFIIFGVSDLKTAFGGFTQGVVWQLFGCLFLINIVKRTNLLTRFGYRFCVLMGGTYLGIIIGIFILSLIFALLIPGPTTGTLIVIFGLSICQALNLEKGRASSGIMIATALAFCEVCNIVYNPMCHGLMAGLAANVDPGVQINYVSVFIHNLCYIPFSIFCAFLIAKLCKPEVEIDGKEKLQQLLREMPPMDFTEKKVLAVMIAMVVYFITNPIHKLDMTYGFLLAPIILMLPGFRIAKAEDVSNVSWNLILFVVGCLAIGNVGGTLGIGGIIANIALPLFDGQGPVVFVLLCYAIGAVANLLMTPLAFMSTLTVPFSQIAIDLGYSCYPVVWAFSQASAAVVFPYETTMTLIMFSFGMCQMKEFTKVFGAKMILTAIWTAVIAVPYWMFLGIL